MPGPNYLKPNSPESINWHIYLNREDMDHDAEPLLKKGGNKLFVKCRDELFYTGFAENYQGEGIHTELPYGVSAIIPKRMGLTKPEVIQETNSIRDTEPAYKLNMPEKYTPAYYFDPASRTFPSEFQNDTTKYNGQTIDLAKYGLAVKIKIEIINNNILAMTIITNFEKFKDTYTTYIHKAGYVVKKVGERFVATKKNDPDVYILGNKEKDAFFRTNENSNNQDIIKKGKRLIIYKLLGDLLHAAFAEEDDLVFTLDTYLRDRCIKSEVSCVVKEKDYLDTLQNSKKNIWTLFYDKIYDKSGNVYYPDIAGGPYKKNNAQKPTKAKVQTVKNPKSKLAKNEIIPSKPLKKFVADGHEINIEYRLSRKDDGVKYKKICCSMYHYHARKNEEQMNIEGGNIKNRSQIGGTDYENKLDNLEPSLISLLTFIKSDIETKKTRDLASFEEFLKEFPYENNDSSETEHEEHYNEILELISSLEGKEEDVIGNSEDFIDLIHLVVDKNIIFEGELESFLIRTICKDEALSKDVQNKLDELTDDLAIYTYDYRILTDFKNYFSQEKIAEETDEATTIVNNTVDMDEGTDESREIVDNNTVDMAVPMNTEEQPIKSLEPQPNNKGFTMEGKPINKENVVNPADQVKNNLFDDLMEVGGKLKKKKTSLKKKKPRKKQSKSKKTKRIQIKKRKQTKKKKLTKK